MALPSPSPTTGENTNYSDPGNDDGVWYIITQSVSGCRKGWLEGAGVGSPVTSGVSENRVPTTRHSDSFEFRSVVENHSAYTMTRYWCILLLYIYNIIRVSERKNGFVVKTDRPPPTVDFIEIQTVFESLPLSSFEKQTETRHMPEVPTNRTPLRIIITCSATYYIILCAIKHYENMTKRQRAILYRPS